MYQFSNIMKSIYILLALLFVFSTNLKSQDYTFRYNQYSGMNQDQLELALKQSQKLERSGKVWTAVGTGMLVGGAIMTFNGISDLTVESSSNWGSFAAGLGIMSLGAFPLGYGLVAWLTGSERGNMIEIELLATDAGTLNFKPTQHGVGLVLDF